MRVTISTVAFLGKGSLDCRKCSHRTVFPNGAKLLIFDYGDHQLAKSVRSLAVLHECGREFMWKCDTCESVPNQRIPELALTRGQRWLQCQCGGTYEQVQVERVLPEVEDEHEFRISPF